MSPISGSTSDPIILTTHRITVVQAPQRSLVSLNVTQASDPDRLFITRSHINVGVDPQGEDVIYRVTGWDAVGCALVVEKVGT